MIVTKIIKPFPTVATNARIPLAKVVKYESVDGAQSASVTQDIVVVLQFIPNGKSVGSLSKI